jgi:transcription antitermination factor NusG
VGDRVKILQGTFENYLGDVRAVVDPGTGGPPQLALRVILGDSEQEILLPVDMVRRARVRRDGGCSET